MKQPLSIVFFSVTTGRPFLKDHKNLRQTHLSFVIESDIGSDASDSIVTYFALKLKVGTTTMCGRSRNPNLAPALLSFACPCPGPTALAVGGIAPL